MIDMKELIPSKDVRRYMEKQGCVLTDFEKAALIYNHSGMSHEKKVKALECILKETADDELRVQIQNRLIHDRQCLKKFYEREENDIYVLKVFCSEAQEWTECGCYVSGEIAVASGKKFRGRFSVYKTKALTEEKEPIECFARQVAALYFDAGGILCNYYSNEIPEIESEGSNERVHFEHACIDIPHPFKNGDLVKVLYNESLKDAICIIECCEEGMEDKENREQRCMYYDYSDVSLRIATLKENAQFGHEHVPVPDIEYASMNDSDLRKSIVDCAVDLLRGCGGLSDLQYACEEYRKINIWCSF